MHWLLLAVFFLLEGRSSLGPSSVTLVSFWIAFISALISPILRNLNRQKNTDKKKLRKGEKDKFFNFTSQYFCQL